MWRAFNLNWTARTSGRKSRRRPQFARPFCDEGPVAHDNSTSFDRAGLARNALAECATVLHHLEVADETRRDARIGARWVPARGRDARPGPCPAAGGEIRPRAIQYQRPTVDGRPRRHDQAALGPDPGAVLEDLLLRRSCGPARHLLRRRPAPRKGSQQPAQVPASARARRIRPRGPRQGHPGPARGAGGHGHGESDDHSRAPEARRLRRSHAPQRLRDRRDRARG